MIEARKLRKVFGQTVAVDGIDFQVKPSTGSTSRSSRGT
jgi:ABC-type multidrug transport system ATPase subunit